MEQGKIEMTEQSPRDGWLQVTTPCLRHTALQGECSPSPGHLTGLLHLPVTVRALADHVTWTGLLGSSLVFLSSHTCLWSRSMTPNLPCLLLG